MSFTIIHDGCQPNNTSSYSYFIAPLIQIQNNNPVSETLYVQTIDNQLIDIKQIIIN